LFSDTGGGHRAAAEAIIEAIHAEFGDAVSTSMVDFLKDYAPPPFNHLPDLYPDLVKVPELWGAFFDISDGRPQARFVTTTFWPYVRNAAHRLVREHHSKVLVSVHPVVNSFALKALGKSRPPYVTVVTDLVSTHALWYDRRADLILVPTEMARQRALEYTMEPEKVRVVGQPVSMRCSAPAGDKHHLREKLGWPLDKFTVLLVGGGEGMGPLAETARAIDESGLDVTLIIVAGRNAKLEAELKEVTWENSAFIYGFVHDMPDFMRAADLIVTKAGPGTIAEALIADLPIILYAKLPGQEDGNVDFVESEKVGVWAPEPIKVVRTLTRWISRPHERAQVVENCRRAARPDASRTIARIVGAKVGLTDRPDAAGS
jgi:1,2-diacylglycerol 3-beta-galactosyltransferase